jgi:acyl-CoA synthetase (NDP forming)
VTGDGSARLSRALSPGGVAVIGASPRPGSLSARFVSGLLRHGFPGRVVPVNPNYDEVLGLPCAAAIEEAGPIDLAVLSVPRRLVLETLEGCEAAGVAGVVIFASGYSETGPEGAAEEREIAAFARRTGLRVIGPNSPGFVNATHRCSVIASGAAFREPLLPGRMAVVAQSGGVAGLLLERAQDRGVGISQVICTGNEADVTVGEVLAVLAADPATGSAAVYMEAIRQGPVLLDGLRAMRDAGKGVVMLKVGATEAGARASAAHTGALADDDDVVNAALDASGAVRVTGFDELIETAGLLAAHGPAASPAIGIVSTSGGAGVVATEAAERAGIVLPPLAAATRERLAASAPDFAAVANPADMSGMFVEDPEIFRGSLSAFLDDPAYEAVVLVLTVHPPELADELARRSIEAAAAASRPLVVLWTAGAMSDHARASLRSAGVPVIEDADRCMTALAARARAGRERGPAVAAREVALPDLAAARASGAALEHEALEVLAAAGVPIGRTVACATADEARAAAAELGAPLVVKAAARDLPHKSDAGAVVLGVGGPDEAAEAFGRVVGAARGAGAEPEGVIVQRQEAPGIEVIVGVRRDPELGLCLVAGLGGVQAELLGDVARRMLPLHEGDARAMLDELRLAPLLHGHRGAPGADLEALAGAIEGVAAASAALGPSLEAIEANPVLARPDGAVAVDALLLFRKGGR